MTIIKFPQNFAVVRFYFMAPFGTAIIPGRLDFKRDVYIKINMHIHGFNNKPICMHVQCVCAHV